MDEKKQRLKEIEARMDAIRREARGLTDEYLNLRLKEIGADDLDRHYVSIALVDGERPEYMFVRGHEIHNGSIAGTYEIYRCHIILYGEYFGIIRSDDKKTPGSQSFVYETEKRVLFNIDALEELISAGQFKVISREEYGEALGRFLNDTREVATDRFNKCEEDDDAQ